MRVLLVPVFALVAGLAMAGEDRTIWLQPGHCIVVGSQQVCAVRTPDAGSDSTAKNTQRQLCKDGIQHEADPNLKGWAHVVITISPEGKKLSETVMKTYGPLGKKECEADLAKTR